MSVFVEKHMQPVQNNLEPEAKRIFNYMSLKKRIKHEKCVKVIPEPKELTRMQKNK